MQQECPEKSIIMELALGALEGHEEREAREHVASCHECSVDLARIEEVADLLKRVAGEAPLDRASGCPDGETLLAYADGSLRAEAETSVESHLAACPACLSELADTWRLAGEEIADASDDAVTRVLGRLAAQGRVAVVRRAEQTITVVRDFARAAAAAVEGIVQGGEPALAAASRSDGGRITLSWEGPENLALESRLSLSRGGLTIIGRVTREGTPLSGVSIAHDSGARRHGPESPDEDGRFGPWDLDEGTNRITLSGSRIPGGAVELTIDVRCDDESETSDR
jgi:anti-sigma factor RsiW